MSHYDYQASKEIAKHDHPFYAIIMAAMRQADTDNTEKLKAMWPDVYAELAARYHAPGGFLPTDDTPEARRVLEVHRQAVESARNHVRETFEH